MARLRAVVVMQPPGFGGRPSPGRLCSAPATASWTASSAASMSPKARMRDATDLPYSSRKIRLTTVSSTGSAALPFAWLSAPNIHKGPYFDRPLDRLGDFRRPGKRGVEIVGLDDVEATEVLLRFHKRTVGGEHLTVGHPHDGRSIGFVKASRQDQAVRRLHLGLEDADLPEGLFHLIVGHRLAELARDAVNG